MNNLSPEVSTRIETLVKTLSENVNNFTEEIGGTPAKYYKLIKGETKPNFDTLYEILNHWPEINGDWILTGRGEMMGQPQFGRRADDVVPSESAEGWKAYAGEKDKRIEQLSAALERERQEKEKIDAERSRILNVLLENQGFHVLESYARNDDMLPEKEVKIISLTQKGAA